LPFNHNLDGHLGETLRKRPGTRLTLVFALLALGAAAASAATPTRKAAPRPALPDTVIARLPHRDLTAREFVLAWHKVDARYRPPGTTLADRKRFLDQLLERELVARAATSEPFVMTDVESAQYLASRAQAIRRALYKQMVQDSTVVTPADLDSARTRIRSSDPGKPPSPQAVETFARSLAEPRRAAYVDSMLKVHLSPVWDDSTKARLARGYAALDPTKPDPTRPFNMKLRNRMPELSPADTGRVLVRTTIGNMTAGDYMRRFNLLNPFDSDFPTTTGEVEARGEQFLGQMWFDSESDRRGTANDPGVLEAMRNKREGIALDHYFAKHIAAKVDTSDAVLKTWYTKNLKRYAIAGQTVVSYAVATNRASADSIASEVRAGAPWDSVCARHAPPDSPMRTGCGVTSAVLDNDPDSVLVAHLRGLKKGEVYVHALPGNAAGNFAIVKFAERINHRDRTFPEARAYVVREVTADQSERLLQAELARLRRKMPVQRNEKALASVDLEL